MSMEFSNKMGGYAAAVERELRIRLKALDCPALLEESMEYSLMSGGKRLRPVLCLAVCEMLGGTIERAMPAACAIEMIHAYSLIHDDLPAMDNDDFRRGQPSNHKKFGEGNAILAGDGLLTLAFCVLSGQENRRVTESIARGAMDMVAGQSLDINGTKDPAKLDELIAKKTGALIRAAVLSGAYASGNPNLETLIPKLTLFAKEFGRLFQITDDILDVAQDGDDAGEEVNYVSVYGMEAAKKEAALTAERALDALRNTGLDAEFLEELTKRTVSRSK